MKFLDKTLRYVFRQGPAANLEAAKVTAYRGEPHWTTDSKRAYISDANGGEAGHQMRELAMVSDLSDKVTVSDITAQDLVIDNTSVESNIHSSVRELEVEKTYNLILSGKYSTANASDVLTLRFKLGDTIFTEILDPKTVTDVPFNIEFKITIRNGTNYSAAIEGHFNDQKILSTPVNGTFAGENLSVTAQWSNADIGNSLTVMQSSLKG